MDKYRMARACIEQRINQLNLEHPAGMAEASDLSDALEVLSAPPPPQWISVGQCLPNDTFDGVSVIVAVINHRGEVVSETDAWLKDSLGGRFDFWNGKVTHWQPLPPPPTS